MKSKLLKLLSFMAIFVSLFVCIQNVSADEVYVYVASSGYMKASDGTYMYYAKSLNGTTQYQTSHYWFTDANGNIYYCIQPLTSANTPYYFTVEEDGWVSLSENGVAATVDLEELKLIMYYGYGYEGRTDNEWYRITQIMIWRALYPSGEFYFTDSNWVRTTKYDSYIAAIQADIDNHDVKPSFYEQNIGNLAYGDTVTLTDTNGVLQYFEAECVNCEVVSRDGNSITIKSTSTSGEIKLNLTRTFTKTGNTETYVMQNETEGGQKIAVAADPNDITTYVTATAVPADSLVQVNKLDGVTASAISGATICLYSSTGTELDCKTSDGSTMSFGKYSTGSYYIQEKTPATGYILNTEKHTFTIDGYGVTQTITLTNYPQSKVYANKVDGVTGETISGATICLYSSTGTELDCEVSDGSLIYFGQYDTGEYYLQEKEPASEYVLNTEKYYITVDGKGTDVTQTITNYPYSKVYVNKVDGLTGEAISGATICLYSSTGTELDCETSDGNTIYFGKYDEGEYYLQEKSAAKGYVLNTEKYYITVDGKGTDVTQTITNDKYSTLTLYKKDGDTLIPLSNVEISIYDEDDVLVYNGSTKSDGTINVTIGLIGAGTYYYVEETVLDGYLADVDDEGNQIKHYFTVDSDGGCFLVETLYNTPTSLVITKTDLSTGEPVSGATITIYQLQEDGSYKQYYQGVTDENGQITLSYLSFGSYYFEETEAPEGYVLNDEQHYFEVSQTNGIIQDTLTNVKYSEITITKTNLGGTDLVVGATIQIYMMTEDEDILVYTGVTDENGTINYDKLIAGEYYFIETNAPEGFILNEDKHYFTVDEDGGISYEETFTNEQESTLVITKKDLADDALLEGATICVYTTDGELVGCVETNADGEGYIYLGMGSYYYVETIAPEGYYLDEEIYYFDITEEGSVLTVTVFDDYIIVAAPNTELTNIEAVIAFVLIACGIICVAKATSNKKNKDDADEDITIEKIDVNQLNQEQDVSSVVEELDPTDNNKEN